MGEVRRAAVAGELQKPVDAAAPMRGSAPFSEGVNPMPTLRFSVALCAAVCVPLARADQRSIVETPMAPPLVSAPLNVNTQGAIYQAGTLMVLYEPPRVTHRRRADRSVCPSRSEEQQFDGGCEPGEQHHRRCRR